MNKIRSNMKAKKNLTLAVSVLFGTMGLQAQDGQFSQYDATAVILNPALTGMYENADFRMNTAVRSQWSSLASSFVTTAFAYDMSMQKRYGFGTYLNNYNMAGIMNTFQAGATAAYNVSQGKANHTLSVGVNLGLLYKKINDQQLVWDAQYDQGYFNTDLPSGEVLQKGSRMMPEVSAGIAYRSTNGRKRVNPYGNFALFHVTTPDESIYRTVKSDMPIRYMANAGVRVEIMDGTYLIPMGIYMRQGNDQLINAGMLAEVSIMGSMYSVVGGASYRLNDAIVAQIGLKHKNAMYRFSYDVNTSPLKAYTNRNGAYEFTVVYYGTHSGRERRMTSSAF
ncbi:MAG: PorP/SprF family type IX secretion system membrane protein [Flavobacteriales bacterium]|nr:PorP/SprF family type IX secretion system membrane protein [Flavobacteriales bacterium]